MAARSAPKSLARCRCKADGGIQHLGSAVPDITAARDTLTSAGARVLGGGEPKIGAHGKPVLFFHPKDFSGALVEIEQA